jgi:hypothetical protein
MSLLKFFLVKFSIRGKSDSFQCGGVKKFKIQSNSARLLGARAGHCLKLVREVLEKEGISVNLDQEGSLP